MPSFLSLFEQEYKGACLLFVLTENSPTYLGISSPDGLRSSCGKSFYTIIQKTKIFICNLLKYIVVNVQHCEKTLYSLACTYREDDSSSPILLFTTDCALFIKTRVCAT